MSLTAFAQFKGARAVDKDRPSGLYNHREYPNPILRYKTCQLKCKAGSLAWDLISQREKIDGGIYLQEDACFDTPLQ